MTISTDNLVQREVIYCISTLVSTCAKGSAHPDNFGSDHEDFTTALDQARELFRGPINYEDAARDEGWDYLVKFEQDGGEFVHIHGDEDGSETGWQEICETHNIEPYETEVYEHWIVSDWLADKLIAKGETIDRDFMGLTVWARTTTGQAISMDAVIQEIHAELVK